MSSTAETLDAERQPRPGRAPEADWLPWSSEGAAGTLLAPAEALFRVAVAVRNALYDRGVRRVHHVGVPVVSVGNIVVGGTGKTPFARWLLDALRSCGASPGLLHGGYGLDEPALHRYWNPDLPIVARADRVSGAREAVRAGADVLVLDDGFQHRRLARDLDLVLVSAESWSERARLLPRGGWREPRRALERAHLVVVTRRTASPEAARKAGEQIQARFRVPVAAVWLEASVWQPFGAAASGRERNTDNGDEAARNAGQATGAHEDRPSGPVLAVAAIARPHAFIENARSAGADVRHTLQFRDHHAYSAEDVRQIMEASAGQGIVTTQKDWIKLVEVAPRLHGWALVQRVVVERGEAELRSAVDRVCALAGSRDGSPPA